MRVRLRCLLLAVRSAQNLHWIPLCPLIQLAGVAQSQGLGINLYKTYAKRQKLVAMVRVMVVKIRSNDVSLHALIKT